MGKSLGGLEASKAAALDREVGGKWSGIFESIVHIIEKLVKHITDESQKMFMN